MYQPATKLQYLECDPTPMIGGINLDVFLNCELFIILTLAAIFEGKNDFIHDIITW